MVETQNSEDNEEDIFLIFNKIINRFKAIKMPKGIEWLDYGLLIQLVIILLWSFFGHVKYENVIVYFSTAIFISYWLLRIIFNPKLYKK